MDVTYMGVTRPHHDWALFCGVSEQTMRWRLAHWDVERAVTTRRVTDLSEREPPRYREVDLTTNEKAAIVRAYIGGASEDDIGRLVGVSRMTVSHVLIAMNIKRKGVAPARVVAGSSVVRATVRTVRGRVIINIEAAV